MLARGDRGQMAPLYAVIVVVACGAVVLLGRLGALAEHRAEARTAADAAALAGAVGGRDAASSMAAANGAQLLDFAQHGDVVEVRVQVGSSHAMATAERDAPTHVAVGGGERAGLAPGVLASLERADQLLGRPVPVTSGFRTRAQQQALYDDRADDPYPVAAPGTSAHERGTAIDVPLDLVPWLRAIGPTVGLCQPLPQSDPVHFEPCPTSRG